MEKNTYVLTGYKNMITKTDQLSGFLDSITSVIGTIAQPVMTTAMSTLFPQPQQQQQHIYASQMPQEIQQQPVMRSAPVVDIAQAEKKDNKMLYIGGGIGALVLVILLVIMMGKK